MYFALNSKDKDLKKVLLNITLENETGKYYFALDSVLYTCYPDEDEILLQSGMKF
jgi:hypothetical protein